MKTNNFKKIHSNIAAEYNLCLNEIYKYIGKNSNFTIKDLEQTMKIKFKAKKIKLDEINLIMGKKYTLYNEERNTPFLVSDEYISNDEYISTYMILNENKNINNCQLYIHRAFMLSSTDRLHPDNFVLFNGTNIISMYLEILCNHSLEDILKRLR